MTDLSRRMASVAAVITIAAVSVLAQRTTPIKRVEFSDTRLKNGLRVIISEDHTAPVFAIAVNYDVGSRDERQGRTGFAHLFEHMMFKGSENVGPGEHPYLMFMYGGSMNGTTNKERTLYFEILPANQLDLALFLEADRMRSLVITKEALANQINAVQEERRLGADNQPYGRTFEVLEGLAYDNPAYEHSVIGSMTDLSAATVDDVAAFFKTYYAPNNAVVSIVGDVDTKTAVEKVRTALREHSLSARSTGSRRDRAGSDGRAAVRSSTMRSPGCPASTWLTRFRRAHRPTTIRSKCWRRCSRAAAARGSTK